MTLSPPRVTPAQRRLAAAGSWSIRPPRASAARVVRAADETEDAA